MDKVMRNRRNYSAEMKAKMVTEMLREERTISEIAAQYSLHANILHKWKKTALEALPGIFKDPRKKPLAEVEKDRIINDLYRQVGLLSMQLEWVKKKCGVEVISI